MTTKKRLEKEFKKLKIGFLVVVLCFFIVAFLFFYLYFNNMGIILFKQPIKIYYENLSCDDMKNAQEMLNQVKPEYMKYIKSITFTRNITNYCSNCWGQNKGNNLLVYYQDDLNYTKETLAHEIIHSWVIKGFSGNEDIVDQIAQTGVTYA